jgi:hypothetical protein
MTLTVIVDKISDDRFSAKIWQPFQIESEGQTPDEAVQRVRELAVDRIRSAKLVQISVPEQDQPHPWTRWMGIWKDNPDIDKYLANIAEYRRNVDAAESSP